MISEFTLILFRLYLTQYHVVFTRPGANDVQGGFVQRPVTAAAHGFPIYRNNPKSLFLTYLFCISVYSAIVLRNMPRSFKKGIFVK